MNILVQFKAAFIMMKKLLRIVSWFSYLNFTAREDSRREGGDI